MHRKSIFCQLRQSQHNIPIPDVQNLCIHCKPTQNRGGIHYLEHHVHNKISSQRTSVSLSNLNLPCPFPNSPFACQTRSYYWSTCSSIYNCFYLFSYEMEFNHQEGGVSSSTFDGWWCISYSFPESSSEPSSVILRCPLSNFLFFWTGSWFALHRDGCVFAGDSALQSRAWWLLLSHFIYLPSIFRLSHTSLRTNSLFFFSLPDSPPLNYILSSRLRLFP